MSPQDIAGLIRRGRFEEAKAALNKHYPTGDLLRALLNLASPKYRWTYSMYNGWNYRSR